MSKENENFIEKMPNLTWPTLIFVSTYSLISSFGFALWLHITNPEDDVECCAEGGKRVDCSSDGVNGTKVFLVGFVYLNICIHKA